MSVKLSELSDDLIELLSTRTFDAPVVVRSSTTGSVWEIKKPKITTVTDEMVLTGCNLQIGTKIVLITTD